MTPVSDHPIPVRRYHSPGRRARAEATRRAIVAAATEQFGAAGWAGTTMRSVARAAGVALPTVEAGFGTKAALLAAAIDVAIAGDHEPVAMLDRPWAARAAAAPTADGLLATAAAELVPAQARSAGLVLAVLEGAPADPELARLAAELVRRRTVMAGWLVDRLIERGQLRPDLSRADAVDTLWHLLDPALYRNHTTHLGHSPTHYRRWIHRTALRALTAPDPDPAGPPAESEHP